MLLCVYLILVVNSLGSNGVSINFSVFIELCIRSSAEEIIIRIATARSAGLQNESE